MTEWISWPEIFQALAGATSLLSIYNMGNKVIAGPMFGFVSATAWLLMSVTNKTWVLLACTIIAVGLHFRNYAKWRREHRPSR